MAGRLLSPFVGLFSLPERGHGPVVIQSSRHRVPARIAAPATPPFRSEYPTLPSRAEMDMASRASAAGLGCVRGTSFAFLFEAGAGVLIYGVFELWHLLR
jgi:hypothetical protein